MHSKNMARTTWTCAELATAINVTTDTIWRWCRQRRIASTRIGKSYLIPASVVQGILLGPAPWDYGHSAPIAPDASPRKAPRRIRQSVAEADTDGPVATILPLPTRTDSALTHTTPVAP